MNRFNRILLTVFSLAALMFACKDDDNTDTPDKEKEAPYIDYKSATDFWFPWQAGDTVIAVVDVNGAYRATVAEGGGWCTVTDIAVNSFIIHYAENRIAADRTTKITLSLEGVDDIEIVVSQRGPEPELVIDSAYAELTAPYQGLDTVVPVNINGVYRVEVETGKEWCKIETLTDINFSFGATSSTVPHQFRFSIAQNSELESRSVKVGVLLTYRDSTARFEFVVNQNPTPILLVAPSEGTVIKRADGFPYTFSWQKTGDIPSYSIALSTDSNFPEDATEVVDVGDVDSYALTLDNVSGLLGGGFYNTAIYWKVTPTDPEINIATETGMFYVQRKVVKSYPLALTNEGERWTTNKYIPDENAYEVKVNGTSDPYFYTVPLTEAIPERNITLSYECRTVTDAMADPTATGFTWEYFVSTPNPDGAKMFTWYLQFSDEYQTHVIELASYATQWGWGAVGHRFRMDTDNYNSRIVGLTMYLKNLRIDVYE
jgi:hypothetical protein